MSLDPQTLASLFEASRDAVVGIENDIIRFANPKAESLLSIREGDSAAGLLPGEILSAPAERFTAAALLAGKPAEFSVVRLGSLSVVRIDLREKSDESPSLARLNAEFADALAAAQLAIDALVGARRRKNELDDRQRSYAAMLYRSYFRVRRLQRHIQLAGAINSGELVCRTTPIPLSRLCRELCRTVQLTVDTRGASIEYAEPDAPVWVNADRDLIETMLLNLLTNSLLRTPKDGAIRVTLSAEGNRCSIAVTDNGEGIPAGRLQEVLRGFGEAPLSDDKAGSGLGLIIARGIAEAHSGSLILESREGVGTSIRVTLPRLPDRGVEYLSTAESFLYSAGMRPILMELSVFLDRNSFEEEWLD